MIKQKAKYNFKIFESSLTVFLTEVN